jgi:hypothetical protein
MTQFLTELGQTEAKNIAWSIKRYWTTFFTDFPDVDGWEDRLAMTWAVQIETDSDSNPENAGTHNAGPHGSQAYDATFEDTDEDWERTRDRVLIIAGVAWGPEVAAEQLETIEDVLAVDAGIFEGMVALDLGELDVPEDMQRIDAVLDRCRKQGLRTNWKDPDPVNLQAILNPAFKASII